MDLDTVRFLCETAARLDSTVPNSKNISRNLRETCVSRYHWLRLEDVLGESELCPVCFTPWSSGRFSLRLQSCSKANKKNSLAKLLRRKPSRLNRYQKALLDRIRCGAHNVMRLTCFECKHVTKKYLTKSTPLQGKGLLDETKLLDNSSIVTQDKPLVKKKKRKRKKDVLCGLKSSVVAQVRQSKAQVLGTSLKVDCNSQVLPSIKTDLNISEKESKNLTNSEEYCLSNKLLDVDNDNLSLNVNVKIDEKNVAFKQNSVESVIKVTAGENISNISSPMLKIKKVTNKIDHIFDQLSEISLNAAQNTENNAVNNSFSNVVTRSRRASDSEESLNQYKRFKNSPDLTNGNYKRLESKSDSSRPVSNEKNDSQFSEIVSHDENKSESIGIDSDLLNESASSGTKKHKRKLKKTADNIKLNLLSQPSLNNMIQSNVCTNLNENKNQRNSNDLSIRHSNGKPRSYVNTKIINNNRNNDKGNNNSKQYSLTSNNRQQTKNKNNNNKKPRNNRLLNKRNNNNNRVFEELNCRNSLCVKDLLNLT